MQTGSKNMPRRKTELADPSPFQVWLNAALDKRGIDVAELSRMIDADYTHVWKIARGNQKKYTTSRRPGYELTRAMGEVVGDISGALEAAQYEPPPGVAASDSSAPIVLRGGQTVRIITPNGPFDLTTDDVLMRLLENWAIGEQSKQGR